MSAPSTSDSRCSMTRPAEEHPSSFASIAADLQLADLWVSSRLVDIDGGRTGCGWGSGRVSVSGSDELDYRGVAAITTKQGFWTTTFARLGGATVKDGKLSFPFRIAGTLESPNGFEGAEDQVRGPVLQALGTLTANPHDARQPTGGSRTRSLPCAVGRLVRMNAIRGAKKANDCGHRRFYPEHVGTLPEVIEGPVTSMP